MTERDQAKRIAIRMFTAKCRRRRNLAKLTIEQKVRVVLQMQRMAREISAAREGSRKMRKAGRVSDHK